MTQIKLKMNTMNTITRRNTMNTIKTVKTMNTMNTVKLTFAFILALTMNVFAQNPNNDQVWRPSHFWTQMIMFLL